MTVFAWILFGVVNGLILNALEPNPSKGGRMSAMILGIVGALSGGLLAFLFFGGVTTGLNAMLYSVVAIELALLVLLYAGRVFRKA